MHILFACGREAAYPRNASIIRALHQLGAVSVISSNHSHLSYKLMRTAWGILRAQTRDVDVCFIGFLGQPLVFPARLRWSGPLVLDAFVSVYDTLCFDRQIIKPNSLWGRFAFHLDRLSCQLADVVV
ncbi:MAG: hypothetical protein QXP27_07650, partial [Candidatus Methanomethyliaceae archaeon]